MSRTVRLSKRFRARLLTKSQNPSNARQSSRARLLLERLEDRLQLSFVVNLPGDAPDYDLTDGVPDSDPVLDGDQTTLRAAIQNANLAADLDLISFSIPGQGPHTIRPAAPLPAIVNPVFIDGYTQPGARMNTNSASQGTNAVLMIELDGSAAGLATEGLCIEAAASTVRGLAINRFGSAGIGLHGDGSFIEGNFLGTDVSGTRDLGNLGHGVSVHSNGNVIGGRLRETRNVISGNEDSGVILRPGVTGNVVANNLIGTDRTGTAALGNTLRGVYIHGASGNVVGGIIGPMNVISANRLDGVLVDFASTANKIQGNFIGTDISGSNRLGNGPVNSIEEGAGVHVTEGSSGNLIERNLISGNLGQGVRVADTAFQNTLLNNKIGTKANGNEALANQVAGVLLTSDAGLNLLDGNLISGNTAEGVLISNGAMGNILKANYIGTNKSGAQEVPHQLNGVVLDDAQGNVIGGPSINEGNLISGNSQNGVVLQNAGTTGNKLQHNYIGTDVAGKTAVRNVRNGVLIDGAPDNQIGGDLAKEGNLISGNGEHGVLVQRAGSARNQIKANYIGTDAKGKAEVANQLNGVTIDNAPGTLVGGPTLSEGNLISGNLRHGVAMLQAGATGTTLQNNYIGTDVRGTAALGNRQHGVFIQGALNNMIGGLVPGRGNIIAFNGPDLRQRGHGIAVVSGTGNAIRGNSIFSNNGRGIDLGNGVSIDSFTLNDVLDPDAGPNNLQDYPVVTRVSFVRGGGGITSKTITWTLDSTPDTNFVIEFFSNTAADPSGFGEGQRFLAVLPVRTAANGKISFSQTFAGTATFISTTTTDANGNTSEFSMVDTDGDAAADAWESGGIDVNEDGTLDLALGTNPNHKDLWVEADAMVGRVPVAGALTDVQAAFAAAPNANVQNPDGANGITLHDAAVDESNIPRNEFPGYWVDSGATPGFDTLKANRFGTPAQRASANSVNILAAKRLVYHYTIFADRYGVGADRNSSGLAEGGPSVPGSGNDFMVTLGVVGGGTRQQQAATFMHEFGHNLGLGHGGGDDLNHKPNYHSIMNYTWQFVEAGVNTWVLDYSRRAFNTLNENSLDERNGIGGIAGNNVSLGNPRTPGVRIVPESGAADFNGMNGNMETGISVDLNGNGTLEILHPFDDWSNLQYYFLEQPNFRVGVHPGNDIHEEVSVTSPRTRQPPGRPSKPSVEYLLGDMVVDSGAPFRRESDYTDFQGRPSRTRWTASVTAYFEAGNLDHVPLLGYATLRSAQNNFARVKQLQHANSELANTVHGRLDDFMLRLASVEVQLA